MHLLLNLQKIYTKCLVLFFYGSKRCYKPINHVHTLFTTGRIRRVWRGAKKVSKQKQQQRIKQHIPAISIRHLWDVYRAELLDHLLSSIIKTKLSFKIIVKNCQWLQGSFYFYHNDSTFCFVTGNWNGFWCSPRIIFSGKLFTSKLFNYVMHISTRLITSDVDVH